MPKNYAKMSDEELHAENQKLMVAKEEAIAPIKEEQLAINNELSRRGVAARLEKELAGLPPETVKQVLADLAEGGDSDG